jgi:hypothetical protein
MKTLSGTDITPTHKVYMADGMNLKVKRFGRSTVACNSYQVSQNSPPCFRSYYEGKANGHIGNISLLFSNEINKVALKSDITYKIFRI